MKKLVYLFVIVVFFVGCASIPRTETNRRLAEFPEEIPGVFEVIKIEVEGAKHCLVHVGQQHWVSGMKDSKLIEVMETQEEIYGILSYLREEMMLKKIYQEGSCEGFSSLKLKELRVVQRNFLLSELSEIIKPDTIEEIKNELIEEEEEFTNYLCNSALGRLEEEGKIILRPAERYFEYDAHSEFLSNLLILPFLDSTLVDNEEIIKLEEILTNNRENALIDIINTEEDQFSLTVYGAAHNFYDNVQRWNKKYPDNKFSYIKILPTTLKHCSVSDREVFKHFYLCSDGIFEFKSRD